MQFRYFSICVILSSIALLLPAHSKAQNGVDTMYYVSDTTNIEALFKKARELGFDHQYIPARRICNKVLELKPNYFEVRTFLGRLYSWDKQFEKARTELSKVLIEKENDYDALNALFDVEFWTESYSVAGDYLRIALSMYPTSEELLLKKAKLHIKLEEKEEAILTLRRILDLVPGQKEAVKLLRSMGGKKYNNNFRAGMLTDLFDKNSAQQLFTTEYGRKFNFGSILLRGNYANKFKKEGIQFEIESYLHLARWLYLDLLAGHSDISIFPEQNYIAEAYFKLPKGFETSLGFRYLMFTKVTKSYTISFSNYYKDYWFSVRTFVTPKTDSVVRNVELGKSSITLITSIRRYFGDPDNFFGVKAGQGRSPDENKALDVADFQKSTQVGIELQKRAVGQWLMKIDVTYAKENQIGSKFTKRLSTNITLKTVF